jgi:hypothetical protein
MEINITQFYNDANPATYSASVAELGNNAGRITWNNAVQRSALGSMLLDTPDKLEAMRAWARSGGGWDDAEIAAWSDVELNALFIQFASGDIREKGGMSWEEYQTASDAGQASGALFEGIDGEIYYSLED